MEIEGYTKIYKDALKITQDRDVAIAIMQEVGKDIRQSQIPENRQKITGVPSELATEKQLDTLDKHGISYPKGITKQEAMRLIQESMDRRK
jgi:hypothetical protein